MWLHTSLVKRQSFSGPDKWTKLSRCVKRTWEVAKRGKNERKNPWKIVFFLRFRGENCFGWTAQKTLWWWDHWAGNHCWMFKMEKKLLLLPGSMLVTISGDWRLLCRSNGSSCKYNEVIKSHFTAISETPIHADHKIVTENPSVCVERERKAEGVKYPWD